VNAPAAIAAALVPNLRKFLFVTLLSISATFLRFALFCNLPTPGLFLCLPGITFPLTLLTFFSPGFNL